MLGVDTYANPEATFPYNEPRPKSDKITVSSNIVKINSNQNFTSRIMYIFWTDKLIIL